jgi:hypothetical protein
MYAVFASFALRPLLRISNHSDTLWHVFTLNSLYTFLRDVLIMSFRLPATYFTKYFVKTHSNLIPLITFFWRFEALTSGYHLLRRLRLFLMNWPKEGYKTLREVK